MARDEPFDPERESLVKLLYFLFMSQPRSACQKTILANLVPYYRGSLSRADLHMFAIFRTCELHNELSITPILTRWSQAGAISSSALEGLLSIDPTQVFRTCVDFPSTRTLGHVQGQRFSDNWNRHLLYDPAFILLLLAHVLETCPPTSALVWIRLLRTNVVSLLFRCLSSTDNRIRMLAMAQVNYLMRLLKVRTQKDRKKGNFKRTILCYRYRAYTKPDI